MTRSQARQVVVKIRAELAAHQNSLGWGEDAPRVAERLYFLESRLGELLEVVASLLEGEDDGR